MKRFVLLFLCALSLSGFRAQAQRNLSGERGVQLTAGSVNALNLSRGFHLGVAYSICTQHADHWLFGIEYLLKQHTYKMLKIPQAQCTLEGGYYLQCVEWNRTAFLSLGASAMAGYESVNRNQKALFDGATLRNRDAFLCGAASTLACELFLTDRVVLLVTLRERMLAGSSVGKVNMQCGCGVRYLIY